MIDIKDSLGMSPRFYEKEIKIGKYKNDVGKKYFFKDF